MRVRCEKDNTVWEATPEKYPRPDVQSKYYDKNGDRVINCPTCCRGYFFYNGGSDLIKIGEADKTGWHSDRPLTILEE